MSNENNTCVNTAQGAEVFQCYYWTEDRVGDWGTIPCISVSYLGYKVAWEMNGYQSVDVQDENRPPVDERGNEVFFEMMDAAERVRRHFYFGNVQLAIPLHRVMDEIIAREEMKKFVTDDDDLPF
jgi:hypothetical protein